jgi:glutathione S-transferase
MRCRTGFPTLQHFQQRAQTSDRLQLFSAPTPNAVKVGIMLEDTSLAYEPHRIDIMADECHDPAWPSGTPLTLFESGAILLYLADKTGALRAVMRSARSAMSFNVAVMCASLQRLPRTKCTMVASQTCIACS